MVAFRFGLASTQRSTDPLAEPLGALLGGLDQRLAHETGMPIRIADEPLYSVVIGSGRALENIDAMRGLMSMGGED